MEPTTGREPPIPATSPQRDQVVTLSGISWEQYAALADSRGEADIPRLAYLDGELEIMSPADRHEFEKSFIARLLEAWADETEVDLLAFGSTTWRHKSRRVGLEADECYFVGRRKKFPDIALEVAHSRGARHRRGAAGGGGAPLPAIAPQRLMGQAGPD